MRARNRLSSGRFATLCAAGALGSWLAVALSQPATSGSDGPATAEFHFARMIYQDQAGYGGFGRRGGGRGRGRGWWRQDWPAAEIHFRQGIARLTRVDAGEGVTVDLLDDRLFDYPWLYATQTGYWDLSDEEIAKLREYLERGGFFVADDFWGEGEWQVFGETMARLFPERRIVEITGGDDEVLHVLYDVDQLTQIPGLRHLGGFDATIGRIRGLPEPHWRGIYDDKGRLMVAINFNQDIGDAWEHADWPEYPEPMTALAYRFGINYIIYAMTH
jgi:Domain of unknown function (DUF4159)